MSSISIQTIPTALPATFRFQAGTKADFNLAAAVAKAFRAWWKRTSDPSHGHRPRPRRNRSGTGGVFLAGVSSGEVGNQPTTRAQAVPLVPCLRAYMSRSASSRALETSSPPLKV